MEVSTFELIYKPQSPVGPADTVLQGYFLNISNLEDVPLTFRLDFVTASVSDPDRSLANNTVAFIDTPDANNVPASLAGALTDAAFEVTPAITVPPQGTAKLAVLPSDPFGPQPSPANFEARGYVTLRLPPRFIGFLPVAQKVGPARVLLTPQNRAVYLDGPGGSVTDQTQAGLPTADGGALVEVPAEGIPISIPLLDPDPLVATAEGRLVPDISGRDVAEMMACIDASGTDLKAVNAMLAEAKIGLALEKRKT